MEEKNWLKELVESSDFEYFDGENYENYEDLEREVAGQGKMSSSAPAVVVAGQGKDINAPAVVVEQGKVVPLQASERAVHLKASANPFTQYQQYNTVNNLFFDLIVKTTVIGEGGVYPPDQTYEVPILYPFANKNQGYENTLSNYGLLLKGATVEYEEGSRFVLSGAGSGGGKHIIEVDGMSFNLSDLYNAILYRNLKLQINKIRFALQDQNDLAYLNTLTMYAIGITSKIQKDSLNVGSFVRPQDFNTYIVDVDMRIVIDYNSILTYRINTAMVDKPASGNAVNTFRMSFFCNILR